MSDGRKSSSARECPAPGQASSPKRRPFPSQQSRPDQRIAIAPQTIGMQAHQDVARSGRVVPTRAEKEVAFDNADREPGQVHLTLG